MNSNSNHLKHLVNGWKKPDCTYKPHTRWWWPGNALSKEDITYQMEQMSSQGMGGIEIMSMWKVYKEGNNEYLEEGFLELIRHAVEEGKRLDMEVALTFSPGWSFGGHWVSKEDQSKGLVCIDYDVSGPVVITDILEKGQGSIDKLPELHSIIAVVAAQVIDKNTLDPNTLEVLYKEGNKWPREWEVPEGNWRIMLFCLAYTEQVCQANNFEPPPKVIDHLNEGAVKRYCDYLGGVFYDIIGEEFGKTVDSFFCDSFEVMTFMRGLIWSTDTLERFNKIMGYDFTPFLPAIWYNLPGFSEHLRYDINYCLHIIGLEAFYATFDGWCREHGVQARIQPHYRFTPEIVQASGSVERPETEVTTRKFETIPDPRKATASGCRFYGTSHVSAEAYTFLRQYRYRTDLIDLKIASDAFLRDGITQFYNHGYFASIEKHAEPTRDFPWANHINHQNTWWKYYHNLTDYLSRCCFMLRQGRLAADVLIYTPQTSLWTQNALWGGARRVMPYGDLPRTLLANGYDYDIVNDDLLQNRAEMEDGHMNINGYKYRILILPAISAMPIETLKALRRFVQKGGIVIALERLPELAPGYINMETNNKDFKTLANEVFHNDEFDNVYFLPEYNIEIVEFDPEDQEPKPVKPLDGATKELINLIGTYVKPDFVIDEYKQSNGLTFIHVTYFDVDVYFVTNLKPDSYEGNITFNVKNKIPLKWDAVSGKITKIKYSHNSDGLIQIPVTMNEWESTFFVFGSDEQIAGISDCVVLDEGKKLKETAEYKINGEWHMKLEADGFGRYESRGVNLSSWTDNPASRHFSGTGRYDIEFNIDRETLEKYDEFILDLGEVGMTAEVMLNGQNAGVLWMPPYKLGVKTFLQPGANRLTVLVTNVLINYINSYKYGKPLDGELKERFADGSVMERMFKDENNKRLIKCLSQEMELPPSELPPSGLMGPVRLLCCKGS